MRKPIRIRSGCHPDSYEEDDFIPDFDDEDDVSADDDFDPCPNLEPEDDSF